MACTPIPGGYICDGGPDTTARRILHCPICKRRRRMVIRIPHAESYYSATVTCCGCGDSWEDGELHERPFQRGWRQKAIAKARAQWVNA